MREPRRKINENEGEIHDSSKLKKVFNYIIIISVLCLGFFTGYYYEYIKTSLTGNKPTIINKSEVTIAIDESDHLLIIDKSSGLYTIYEDSIGIVILNMYANSVFKSHNADPINLKIK